MPPSSPQTSVHQSIRTLGLCRTLIPPILSQLSSDLNAKLGAKKLPQEVEIRDPFDNAGALATAITATATASSSFSLPVGFISSEEVVVL